MTETTLTGWGNLPPTPARVLELDAAELRATLRDMTGADRGSRAARGLTPRGRGRSYGDPAQNSDGTVTRILERGHTLDARTGELTCGGGAELHQLTGELLEAGWMLPAIPGTAQVTIGGMIAADVHGKNHHRDGSLGHHVRGIRLLTADGEVQDLGPENGDLYWATIGGMGLTGVILEARLQLTAIETPLMRMSTTKHHHVTELMEQLRQDTNRYQVAWLDLSDQQRLGRSICTTAEHATRDELAEHTTARVRRRSVQLAIPRGLPIPRLVNRVTTRSFNALWFAKAAERTGVLEHATRYFHPLDGVRNWNLLYGRRGFHQYHFVVPDGAEEALRAVLHTVAVDGHAGPLVVLKRFGAGNPGMLSFPMPGWSLAIDLPARGTETRQLANKLDDIVLEAGGRHYLAKDSLMTPETLRRGYQNLDRWLETKHRVDPGNLWQSDLSRRLGLT